MSFKIQKISLLFEIEKVSSPTYLPKQLHTNSSILIFYSIITNNFFSFFDEKINHITPVGVLFRILFF